MKHEDQSWDVRGYRRSYAMLSHRNLDEVDYNSFASDITNLTWIKFLEK